MPTVVISKETQLTGPVAKSFFAFLERRSAWGCAFLDIDKYHYDAANFGTKYGPKSSHTERFIFDVQNAFYFRKNKSESAWAYVLYFPQLPPLGKGHYATVYSLDATVCATEIAYRQGGEYSNLVIKVQSPEDGAEEFVIAKQLPHLGVEVNIVHNPTDMLEPESKLGPKSALVMKRMPGCDLFDFLSQNNLALMTWPTRLKLQRAILNAIYSQITSHGVIHRDIKIENIMCDKKGEDFEVNIVDVGVAIKLPKGQLGLMSDIICGTKPYFPKETIDARLKARRGLGFSYWQSFKMDVFSTGRMLFQLWGGHDKSYEDKFATKSYRKYYESKRHLDFSRLFRDLTVLPEYSERVKSLLTQMLQLEVDKRISMKEAMQNAAAICTEYLAQYGDPGVCSVEKPVERKSPTDLKGPLNSLSFHAEHARRRGSCRQQSYSDAFFGGGEPADVMDSEAPSGLRLG